MKPAETLRDHLGTIYRVFGKDPDLVRTSAMQHGKNIYFAHITDTPNDGEYNVHIPTGTSAEVEAIAYAHVVTLGCIDWRLSERIFELTKPDIYFTNAGGPIQPDLDRLQALTNLYAIIHKINPRASLIAVAHDEICKGADHFSGGKVREIRYDMNDPDTYRSTTDQSLDARKREHEFLLQHVQKFYNQLRDNGVAPGKIVMEIAEIHREEFYRLHKLQQQDSQTEPLQFARSHK